MNRKMAIDLIEAELERAERLHPQWPEDRVYQAAIVAEEAGEALQAALNMRREDYHHEIVGGVMALQDELVQTGAMALRALINLK